MNEKIAGIKAQIKQYEEHQKKVRTWVKELGQQITREATEKEITANWIRGDIQQLTHFYGELEKAEAKIQELNAVLSYLQED